MDAATLLSLSLFILLLAFFIVLNAISNYSQPKVDAAFDSLDIAFTANIRPAEAEQQTPDETQEAEDGEGDSIEDIQGVLRSILPGLDMDLTDDPNGGKTMAIRMKKDMFDRLSPQLIPVFARVLNIKDGEGDYNILVTSYVRNVMTNSARQSYAVLRGYGTEMTAKGIAPNRMHLALENGNPAFMQFRFERGRAQE